MVTSEIASLSQPFNVGHRSIQKVKRSAHTASKATAQQFVAQLLGERGRLDRSGRPRRTYKEALKRFRHDYLPTLKPTSQQTYRTSFRQEDAAFEPYFWTRSTARGWPIYASARMKAGAKGATVRRDLAAMSRLCSCAVARDYIDCNPLKQFLDRHIKESQPRTTYPTAEQVDRRVASTAPMTGRI